MNDATFRRAILDAPDDDTPRLSEGTFAQNLQSLQITECLLSDQAVANLFAADFPQLEVLNMADNKVGKLAASALPNNGTLPSLKELNMARCKISPEIVRIFSQALLPSLRELDLYYNPIGLAGIQGLVEGALVRSLDRLKLMATELGDAGVEVLAKSPAVANVKSLDLSNNQITYRGAMTLAKSRNLAGLQWLRLSDNKLNKKSREVLTKHFEDRVSF